MKDTLAGYFVRTTRWDHGPFRTAVIVFNKEILDGWKRSSMILVYINMTASSGTW